jgi:hypothetical protein
MLAGVGSELGVNSTSDPGLMFSVFWSMEQDLSSIFTFSVGRLSTTSRRSKRVGRSTLSRSRVMPSTFNQWSIFSTLCFRGHISNSSPTS